MSDFPRRILTVSIGFPAVWYVLSCHRTARIFFWCCMAIANWEWTAFRPCSTASDTLARYSYCVASAAIATCPSDGLFLLLLYCVSSMFVAWNRTHHVCGLLFLVVPFRAWMRLSSDFPATISLLLTVWNCDTGALLGGRLATRFLRPQHRIPVPLWVRRVSPAKSIEGFVGGVLLGALTAAAVVPWMAGRLIPAQSQNDAFTAIWVKPSIFTRALLGSGLSLLGIAGDLAESAAKRHANVKDSGKLLPGHGGVIDRFDSTLPAVLVYSSLLEFFHASQ